MPCPARPGSRSFWRLLVCTPAMAALSPTPARFTGAAPVPDAESDAEFGRRRGPGRGQRIQTTLTPEDAATARSSPEPDQRGQEPSGLGFDQSPRHG